MIEEPQAIILLVIYLIIAGIIIIYSRREKRRRKALEALAGQLGLHFIDEALPENLPHDHSLFNIGRDQRVYNMLNGAYLNYGVQCFDFSYASLGGRRNGEEKYSAALCDIKVPLKYLFIRPDSFLDKVASLVGIHDVTFDAAEFNRTFHVKSEDKKFAYDVVHPRMMEFLLHCGSRYTIELCGNIVLAYKSGALQPDEVKPMLDTLVGFANLLPEYLLEQAKTRKEE